MLGRSSSPPFKPNKTCIQEERRVRNLSGERAYPLLYVSYLQRDVLCVHCAMEAMVRK